jgi:subtilisin family serine protease
MKRCLLLTVAVICMAMFKPVQAAGRFIVRTTTGLEKMQSICTTLGCKVARTLDGSIAQVFLVTTPDSMDPARFLAALISQSDVVNAELDLLAKIKPPATTATPSGLWNWKLTGYYIGPVWYGYAYQPASQIIRAGAAQSMFRVTGAGIVAVIDTGIDPDHPTLRNVLVPGYDFTRNVGTASEKADLSQSTAAVVDGWPPVAVSRSTIAVIDPTTAKTLSQAQYADFGHGTMVAGVIHLVAPRALILPLKAFQADGTGYTSDIIRAIYYAVRNRAKILNMSFSLATFSLEVKKAVDFASKNGLISVAAAGNDGQRTIVYPAGLSNVIAVASTSNTDQRSSFSNYGSPPVWVAAPGEAIISTYPFGTYGASWGTSFSAPFVSGTAALLLNVRSNCNQAQAAGAIAHAKPIGQDLGNGRLDVYEAVRTWVLQR